MQKDTVLQNVKHTKRIWPILVWVNGKLHVYFFTEVYFEALLSTHSSILCVYVHLSGQKGGTNPFSKLFGKPVEQIIF